MTRSNMTSRDWAFFLSVSSTHMTSGRWVSFVGGQVRFVVTLGGPLD